MSTNPRSPEPPIAALRGVTKSYPDETGRQRSVVENVDLEVRRGEVVAILGPSGCGKSTLLRMLIGLIDPTSGAVLEHGRPLHGILSRAAVVFQSFALFPWLTVEENVAVGLGGTGISEAEAKTRVREAVERVGLAGNDRSYPKELSGGMKQRVGIARALVGRPELLCMDEPFSALDVLTAELLRAEVYRLWSDGTTGLSSIVLITHIIDEAVYLGDRILVLGTNPGTVKREIVNTLPHPREYRHPEFLRMVLEIHDIVTGVHLPEEAAPAAAPPSKRGPGPIVPVPDAKVGQMLGMLEILADHGGTIDLFELDALTLGDFGRTIAVVKGAELLDFVDTPKNVVLLTDPGRALLAEPPATRRHLFRKRLLTLGLFTALLKWLAETPDAPRSAEEAQEFLAARLPGQPIHEIFQTVVDWGRYGMLFDFDPDSGEISCFAGRGEKESE